MRQNPEGLAKKAGLMTFSRVRAPNVWEKFIGALVSRAGVEGLKVGVREQSSNTGQA